MLRAGYIRGGPGADPGFRRGGFVQEFQERIQIVAGPWANQQAKKRLQTAVGGGGGPITPPPQKKNNLYPRMRPAHKQARVGWGGGGVHLVTGVTRILQH